MAVLNNDVRIMVKSYLDTFPEDESHLARLLDLLADAVDVTTRDETRGHLTASAVVFNPSGLILLVEHLASGLWIQPGGHPEPEDETLADTALRELAEETGIPPGAVTLLHPGPVQIHAHTTPVRYSTHGPAHYHFDVRFAFCTAAEVGPLQIAEVGGADWFTPDRVPDDALRGRVLNLATT